MAVLDTGYDRDHPDLADTVVAERDFTGGPTGVADGNGHGTHVASTVAGSGAAAGGRHRGVAPDADLLVGKVCGDDGWCLESAVIEGMAWAAEQRVDVVNLSLGGGPTDGTDPQSTALNELTERFGTLFVVAAGNYGQAESVSAPAVAHAALAVASVTKQDTPSGFSSRGPRPGDHAFKPDIAAPGTDIVAARATGTLPDNAVSDDYARLSGTSMAAPHVSGAAAILAGSRPDWTAERLKAVLMGTATPVGDASVYTIGTGRLDVAAADRATVRADRGSVGFGRLGEERTRQKLSYHNDGAEPVTMTLRTTLTDRFGERAPDGLLTVEPSSITVPANGTATTTVTATPAAARPGLFGGRITASAKGRTVVTTGLGLSVGGAPRTLTVNARAAKGEFSDAAAIAQNLDSGEVVTFWVDTEGPTPVRLPAGRYRLTGMVTGSEPIPGTGTPPERLVSDTTLFADEIDLSRADATLVVDGTTAGPVNRGVDDPAMGRGGAGPGETAIDLALPNTSAGPASIGATTPNLHDVLLLPSKKIDGLLLHDSAVWQQPVLSVTQVGTGREFGLWDPARVDFLGEVTAPLVDVGAAGAEDLAGRPMRGAIALFTPPPGLPADEIERRVAALGEAGAALVILGEPDLYTSLPTTAGATPVVWAHYLDRLGLQEALAAGPVSLRVRGVENSPRGYFTYHQVEDRLPAGITWSDRRDRMATVATRLHDSHSHRSARPLLAYVRTDRVYAPYFSMEVRPPGETTLHVTPGVPFAFETVADWPIVSDPADDRRPVGWQTSPPRRFERGERVEMPWLKAPYGPALSTTTTGTEGETLPLAYRSGDELNLSLPMFADSPGTGRHGWYDPNTDTGSTTLSRDGRRIGHNDVPGIAGFDLPAGHGRYELTVDAGYRLPDWPLATRVTDTWSFASSGAHAGALPLLDVSYDLPLDLTNAAPSGKELTGAVQVGHQVGAERSRITSVRLDVSYDDGASWHRAVVGRDGPNWTVRIPAGPSGREFASLRTTATDAADNTVTETLVRAYRLA